MPNWCHGFARHNGYGPPPQFPGASPSPGIVHYLSGHSMHALRCSRGTLRRKRLPRARDLRSTLDLSRTEEISPAESGGTRSPRSDAHSPKEGAPQSCFHCRLQAFTPLDSHTCYTPWPVFRDVTDGAGLITILAECWGSSRRNV